MNKNLNNIYHIKEDSLILDPAIGEGRMILALVLDSDNDTGLKDLVSIHQDTPPGDVKVQWGAPCSIFSRNKKWYLDIKFDQPLEFNFQIEFDLNNNLFLIDAIIQSRGLYVMHGKNGDKVSQQKNMVLIEVPDTKIDTLWEKTLNKSLKRKFSKKGIQKKFIKQAIIDTKKKYRELLKIRYF